MAAAVALNLIAPAGRSRNAAVIFAMFHVPPQRHFFSTSATWFLGSRHIIATVEPARPFYAATSERMRARGVCQLLGNRAGADKIRSRSMRKFLTGLTLAAAAAMATSALADPTTINPNYETPYYGAAPVAAGAVTGTAVGVGIYEGWLGSSAAVSAVPATAAGAAAAGGVIGVGTIALVDAFSHPCRGFGMLVHKEGCVNGEWVGDRPLVIQRHRRVSMR
jgi:hypothetical protein